MASSYRLRTLYGGLEYLLTLQHTLTLVYVLYSVSALQTILAVISVFTHLSLLVYYHFAQLLPLVHLDPLTMVRYYSTELAPDLEEVEVASSMAILLQVQNDRWKFYLFF